MKLKLFILLTLLALLASATSILISILTRNAAITSRTIDINRNNTYNIEYVATDSSECKITVTLCNESSNDKQVRVRSSCKCINNKQDFIIHSKSIELVELNVPFSPDGNWLVNNLYISTEANENRVIIRTKRGYMSDDLVCSNSSLYFDGSTGCIKHITVKCPEGAGIDDLSVFADDGDLQISKELIQMEGRTAIVKVIARSKRQFTKSVIRVTAIGKEKIIECTSRVTQ
jgi:hypothetical protein